MIAVLFKVSGYHTGKVMLETSFSCIHQTLTFGAHILSKKSQNMSNMDNLVSVQIPAKQLAEIMQKPAEVSQ